MKEISGQYYDEALHEVFSQPVIIESLMKNFVNKDWVHLIDFSSLTFDDSVSKKIERNRREFDRLFHFKLINGDRIYLYILLEFKSTPQRVCLKLREYTGRIYGSFEKMYEIGKWPLVIPIVIYIGEDEWYDSLELKQYFHVSHPAFRRFLPGLKYILINEKGLSKRNLKKIKSALSYFFLLDKTNLKEREKAVREIIKIFKEIKDTQNRTIYDLLAKYIYGLFIYKKAEGYEQIKEAISKEEGMSTLVASIDAIRQEGFDDGRKEELRATIYDFLADFGPVDSDIKSIVEKESDMTLLRKWRKLSARVKSASEFLRIVKQVRH